MKMLIEFQTDTYLKINLCRTTINETAAIKN